MISSKSDTNGGGSNAHEFWKFFDYSTVSSNPIEAWYQELSDEAKFTFDSLLKNIHKVRLFKDWCVYKKHMKGDLQQYKIFELGFRADRREYRVLGIFGEERKQVIFLIGCYHKEGRYSPPNALKTAVQRVKDLREMQKRGEAILNERKIQFDI